MEVLILKRLTLHQNCAKCLSFALFLISVHSKGVAREYSINADSKGFRAKLDATPLYSESLKERKEERLRTFTCSE